MAEDRLQKVDTVCFSYLSYACVRFSISNFNWFSVSEFQLKRPPSLMANRNLPPSSMVNINLPFNFSVISAPLLSLLFASSKRFYFVVLAGFDDFVLLFNMYKLWVVMELM